MTRFIPSETILPSLTRTAPKTPPVQYSSDARCDSSMARRRNVLCSMFSCGLDIARFVTLFCIQKKVNFCKYHDYCGNAMPEERAIGSRAGFCVFRFPQFIYLI